MTEQNKKLPRIDSQVLSSNPLVDMKEINILLKQYNELLKQGIIEEKGYSLLYPASSCIHFNQLRKD